MCLTKPMRTDLERARAQLIEVIETLANVSEQGVCDDLIRCQDGFYGNHEGLPPIYLGKFLVPYEASPLIMASRLYSWVVALTQRLDALEAAKN